MGRHAIGVVGSCAFGGNDWAVQNLIVGGAHPAVQTSPHFGKSGALGRIGDDVAGFVGIEHQIEQLF